MARAMFAGVLFASPLAGCIGSFSSASPGDNAGNPTGVTPPSGTSTPPPVATTDGGTAVPPAQPADPQGFQKTISPLLEQNGCMECHHAGRPIDLSSYPFMAGGVDDTAQRLIACLGTTMPPAPRDAPPASLADAIKAWKAAGAKP